MPEPTPCLVCRKPLGPAETRTCLACLSEVRRDLHSIARLFALLPSLLGHPSTPALGTVMGIGNEEPPLPGGDALAMLAPGSPSHNGDVSDPPAVAFELGTWVEDWAEVRGEEVPASVRVEESVEWLSRRAGWAAGHHDAFDEFAWDVERIHGRLEEVTSSSDRPELGPPCLYCRVPLQRRWLEREPRRECRGHPDRCDWPHPAHGCADRGGREDDWRCPRCHRVFSPEQYWLAVRAELAARSALEASLEHAG